jgi:type III restriction enzyme
MKFTLKDYQEEALSEVLDRLRKARRRWHEDRDRHAFSLTATTGAGKTVIAAAVFEALLFGNDDYEFEADPGAVVIWFSDDPSLNTQSLWRLQEASDKLTTANLVTVETSFQREKLEAGKVYFLNTQKLGRKSLLVRGHDPGDSGLESVGGQTVLPDARSVTIWDTIQNTIEDPNLTLYLVLDEAHRGMGEGARSGPEGRQTIVKQLINGFGSVPGIPVVWGISATVERFNAAIADMKGHSTMPPVIVDARKVQESGLLKDTINLDVPDETGNFASVLVRRGTDKLRDISAAWADYARNEGDPRQVLPLMVLQVPNSPDHNEIGRWLDTIFDRWPELPVGSVANVFGEHREETFGSRSAPYIDPERVQESDWVRVLVAKDAISTGWDCPRAEVMVSFRSASDKTHITQLLGRMVRTPLARRIPGNDRLNAVDCLLPHFDRNSVEAVVTELMTATDSNEEFAGRRVLINPIEVKPNPAIPEEVWDRLLALPSQTLPKKQARPIKRLTILAHELAADGLVPDAGKKAHAELHKVLDGLQVRYAEEIKQARQDVLVVEGKTVKTNVKTGSMSFDDFLEAADYAVIEDAYRRAARIVSPDLARTYCDHLADKAGSLDDPEQALIDAQTVVAALGLVSGIKGDVEAEAEKLSKRWLDQFRVEIKALTDERQDVYREIREMSADPQDVDLAKPTVWLQATTSREADGTEVPLQRYNRHLLSDVDGTIPADLNAWERHVIDSELKRPGSVGWYRNPARATQESIGMVYQDGGRIGIVRPDFIFFSKLAGGQIAADIVDPHGAHLGDALPKLKGLAAYAVANGALVRRVEAVAFIGGKYRVLDLTLESVRHALAGAASAKDLYSSELATDYLA